MEFIFISAIKFLSFCDDAKSKDGEVVIISEETRQADFERTSGLRNGRTKSSLFRVCVMLGEIHD